MIISTSCHTEFFMASLDKRELYSSDVEAMSKEWVNLECTLPAW